jgi:hypothetical protein
MVKTNLTWSLREIDSATKLMSFRLTAKHFAVNVDRRSRDSFIEQQHQRFSVFCSELNIFLHREVSDQRILDVNYVDHDAIRVSSESVEHTAE